MRRVIRPRRRAAKTVIQPCRSSRTFTVASPNPEASIVRLNHQGIRGIADRLHSEPPAGWARAGPGGLPVPVLPAGPYIATPGLTNCSPSRAVPRHPPAPTHPCGCAGSSRGLGGGFIGGVEHHWHAVVGCRHGLEAAGAVGVGDGGDQGAHRRRARTSRLSARAAPRARRVVRIRGV